MNLIFRFLLISIISICMLGCFSNTYTGDDQIVKDGWLNSHANVRVVRQTEVNGDLLNIQVEVENTFPFSSRFNYKFDFFDAEGRMLYSPISGFKQQQVPAGGFVTITGQASNPKATDFRLTLTNAD